MAQQEGTQPEGVQEAPYHGFGGGLQRRPRCVAGCTTGRGAKPRGTLSRVLREDCRGDQDVWPEIVFIRN
jgi:hypothetical protein